LSRFYCECHNSFLQDESDWRGQHFHQRTIITNLLGRN
jgi:hypothetical protein